MPTRRRKTPGINKQTLVYNARTCTSECDMTQFHKQKHKIPIYQQSRGTVYFGTMRIASKIVEEGHKGHIIWAVRGGRGRE